MSDPPFRAGHSIERGIDGESLPQTTDLATREAAGCHPGNVRLRPPEHGVHPWVLRAAWQLRKAGWSNFEAAQVICATEPFLRAGRSFQHNEVQDAVAKAFNTLIRQVPKRAKMPSFEPDLLKQFIAETKVPTSKEFSATSPDDPNDYTSSDFLRMAFTGDELACLGRRIEHGYSCSTLPLEMHLHDAIEGNLLVPNPMSKAVGEMPNGKLSPRCRANSPTTRRFIVLEADRFGENYHQQLAIILAIRAAFPEAALAAVAYSGKKSLHSWWRVDHLPDDHVTAIYRQAVRLGVDTAPWSLTQLVRLPGALRENGVRQVLGWVDAEVLDV